MQKKPYGQKRAPSPILGTLIGTGLCLLAVALSLTAAGAVAALSKNPTPVLGLISLAAYLFAGGVFGWLSGRRAEKFFGGFLPVLLCAAVLTVLSVILTAGHVPARVLMNALCFLLVGAFGALMGSRPKKKRRRT